MYFAARVKQTTISQGTGNLNLGAAPTGYRSFYSAFGTARFYYTILDGTAWEYGVGYCDTGVDDMRRDVVFGSSAGGSKLSLSAGTKTVFCALLPEGCVNNGVLTFPDGATQPSVKGGRVFEFLYTNPATVTSFTNAVDGQELYLVSRNSNVTIQKNSTILLTSGGNYAMTANDTLVLLYLAPSFYEISRSVL